jgi:hypothetical protein
MTSLIWRANRMRQRSGVQTGSTLRSISERGTARSFGTLFIGIHRANRAGSLTRGGTSGTRPSISERKLAESERAFGLKSHRTRHESLNCVILA